MTGTYRTVAASTLTVVTPAVVTLAVLMLAFAGPQVRAASPEVNLGYFNKLAMNGYDVMSYWRGGKPLEGDREISMTYKGATWVFVSEQNRAMFTSDPERYAPRYGGYCAYAAAQGEVSDVDAFAWRIYKDRLYLNYGPRVRRTWASKIDENIAKADAIWPAPLGLGQ